MRRSRCRAPASAQELAALAGEVGRICRRTLEVPQVLSCKGMTTLLFSESLCCGPCSAWRGAAARAVFPAMRCSSSAAGGSADDPVATAWAPAGLQPWMATLPPS
ncbi:MAG: hypothetical protein ACLVJH_17670 [Faecalibacterium prausnitzii]